MNTIVVTELDSVAYVKLSRPDVRNSFNPEMIEELTTSFKSFTDRKDLRAVALLGDGKAFCAGADLNWMKAMVNYSFEQNKADSEKLYQLFAAIMKCPLPVLGMVHGAAYGGALGLIACCDYVIAETSTQFCFSEVKIGLVPAVISSFVLRKAIPGMIRPYMMSGIVFDNQLALRSGLVHEVCPDKEGHHRLTHVIAMFKEGGPESVRTTKKLLGEIEHMTWEEQHERTTRTIAEVRVSTEGQEGLKSFLEKRQPAWKE